MTTGRTRHAAQETRRMQQERTGQMEEERPLAVLEQVPSPTRRRAA